MEFPYYFTWTNQKNPVHYSLLDMDGPFILTDTRKKLFDLSSLSFQASFGPKNPIIIERIIDQLKSLPICTPKSTFELKNKVANKLLDYVDRPGGKIFFTVSGAESIENALKMCRQIKNKKIILARQNSYHGASLGALSVTGDWRTKDHFTVDEWTVRIPEPHDDPNGDLTEEIILKAGPENIAGFCLETISGANGVVIPSQEWWDKIMELKKKYNLFLILDETVCGFYRTGKNFGFHHFNLNPDFVTMAKAISGGIVPFGAVWTSREISQYYDEHVLSCGLTNYAHPPGLASLDAVFSIVESTDFKTHVDELTSQFSTQVLGLAKLPLVKSVRTIGLLACIELKNPISFNYFYENGLHLVSNSNGIILAPTFSYQKEQLKEAMDLLKKLISEYKS